MTRIIKFRVWDEGEKAFNTPKLIGNGFPNHFTGTVLEQFTGLLDRTGREIYEGDLIKRIGHIHIVKWHQEKARFVCYNPQVSHPSFWGLTSPASQDYHFEVVGNIHENPEMLS